MSEIGDIYARYGESLEQSLDDFQESRKEALKAVQEHYEAFLKDLIRNNEGFRDSNSTYNAEILRLFREFFNDGDSQASFAAIDGTCGKEQLSEMLVFYGGSYAQNGTLNLGNDKGKLSYQRWTPREDTSFVAYLPVPLYSLAQFQDEDWLFRADDSERTGAAMIHTGLMQLAEIYLAYKRVISEDRPPSIILLDHSLSSILLSTDVMHLVRPYSPDKNVLGWIDSRISLSSGTRKFEPADALVAHAHPVDRHLDVPSTRSNAIFERLVAESTDFWQIGMTGERQAGKGIPLSQFSHEIQRRIMNAFDGQVVDQRFNLFRLENQTIYPTTGNSERTLRQRWYDLRELFEDTCKKLFRERRQDALRLTYPSDTPRAGQKWMDENDVRFLVGVGLRLLIEECWRKHVLLVGIAKDSSSRYFTKNFLSVMKASDQLDIPQDPQLTGTDRLICEMIPWIDSNVIAPWSSVEFDAIFMTLRALTDPNTGKPKIQGVRGDILTPSDGLILRSLVHFFLQRRPGKRSPLMGHVMFMDRIAYPYFDAQSRFSEAIETDDSSVHPMIYGSNGQSNSGQDIALVITDFLTRNLFPEAIGQPDPLHRADLGAKALGKRLQDLIYSSAERLRQQGPLTEPFRDTRDRG